MRGIAALRREAVVEPFPQQDVRELQVLRRLGGLQHAELDRGGELRDDLAVRAAGERGEHTRAQQAAENPSEPQQTPTYGPLVTPGMTPGDQVSRAWP